MLHSSQKRSGFHILVDCANYFLDNENNGDKAVFNMAAQRLFEFWPDASVTWITLDPGLIRRNMPGVLPYTLQARHTWRLFGGTKGSIAAPRAPRFQASMTRWMLHKKLMTRVFQGVWQSRQGFHDQRKLLDIYKKADLVMVLAGGAFSDHFAEHAIGLLDTLEGGIAFGHPTALFSCGFEQVQNPALNAIASSVLPKVTVIGCREGRYAPHYLESVGVSASNYAVTGDEAVELAYRMRPSVMGQAIGVNIRQSSYSELDQEDVVQRLSEVLFRISRRLDAPLLPIPISMFGPSDPASIKKTLQIQDQRSDGGSNLDSPEKVIRQAGQCRIVVTGSYHAAVFALSQGIPVIAFARSHHYLNKFNGLIAQFGDGCALVDLSNNMDFTAELGEAVLQQWKMAEELKPMLLNSAREQIRAGRELYRRLQTLAG
jgi:polysaccharide pyruvyl transferase WcaK-like protein